LKSAAIGVDRMDVPAATTRVAGLAGKRLRRIDALRGIAALLVVWLHVAEIYAGLGPIAGKWIHEWARLVDAGRVGVVAFFLVSGFVVPYSIRSDRPAAVGSFLIKRFFRIFPAYWLSIPFGALTGWWIWDRAFSGRDFLLNLTLLHDVFGARPAEGLYWTLLVELVFYALCVVLLLTRSLHHMRRIWALAAAFTFVYSSSMLLRWAGWPTLGSPAAFWFLNLAMMLCGTLYRSCVFDRDAADDRWLRLGVVALFAFHLLVLPVASTAVIGFERNATIPYALGMLLFVVCVSVVPVASRLTDWLGRISYSIYLFHPVVFLSIYWWLGRQPVDSWWRSWHLGAYLAVNIGLTLIVADRVYRWVERPGNALGRRFAERWAARSEARRGLPFLAGVAAPRE
jgi:peptidoglycan/LPS O-acetylase OafA/YrhL